MILNSIYYQSLWNKYQNVQDLSNEYRNNSVCLTVKIILDHYRKNLPIHFNFQNSKGSIFNIARHLFVELANDIYLNHYDLPDSFNKGDILKRICDNQYYEVFLLGDNTYSLTQILRKSKAEIYPVTIPEISYDRLCSGFIKVDTGISEKTIKNYFNFFNKLNNKKSEFPKTNFEMKSVFISRKSLWDKLKVKNKIPSTYLPNPREESHLLEIKSISALSDCIIYFTPKYEVCYQNLLLQNEKIKTIVVLDTEEDKTQQIIQDKSRFDFNLIVLSNNLNPNKNSMIPCWNWFKEEINLVNSL
jgi:hypothetical protein